MKKFSIGILTIALMGSMLSGCGNSAADTQGSGVVDTQESSVENPGGDQTQSDGAGAAEKDAGNAAANGEGSDGAAEAVDRTALYEAFCKGEAPLYFDRENYKEYYENEAGEYGEWPLFEEGKPYIWSEILTVLETVFDKEEGDFAFGQNEYAYIDCGNDGVPELLVKICEEHIYGSFYDLWVIKEMDDRLELCYRISYGYRSEADINAYGVVRSGGSGGASLQVYDEAFVDADGVYHFVYGVNTELNGRNFGELYRESPAEALDEELMSGMVYDSYYFDRDFSYTDDFDWDVYYNKFTYVYYRIDENYTQIDDPSIYEEDSAYYKLAHDSGRTIATPEEVEELVRQKKEAVGLRPELEEDKPLEWHAF